jgi:lysophospholipase L1-like esterase
MAGRNQMSKIIFVGHSVVKGTDYGGVTATDTFGYKIGIAAGYAPADIVVKGVGSEKSAGLLARLPTDVPAGVYDVCVVMIGANDWSTGVSVATFTSNLRAIANYLSGIGTKMVLMTDNMYRGSVAQFIAFGAYQDATRGIALEFDAPLIDIFARMCYHGVCLDHAKYYANTTDLMHFSILGHTWAANVAMGVSPHNIFN